MALTNSQYNTIIRTYEERQLKAHHDLEQRQAYVSRTLPLYQELTNQISSLSLECAERMLDGDDSALTRLKKEISLLRTKKEEILKNAGLSADYLELHYQCPDCKDTGYINNVKCHCFKQQIISFLYQQSNIEDMLKENNFSTLSYDFYEREDGFDALCKEYGMKFKKSVDLDIGLKYDAINSKEIDIMNVFTTDGQLSNSNVVLLDDDKEFYQTYYCGTIVRNNTLKKYPELKDVLMKMNNILTEGEMAELNYKVETEKEDEVKVAKDFLKDKGLLK